MTTANIPARIEELQAQLKEREAELRSLKRELKTALEESEGTELRLTDSDHQRWRVETLLVGSVVGELTEEERERLRAASTDIRQGVWARRDNF